MTCGCWSLRQMGRSFWSTLTSPTCNGLATALTLLGPWRKSRSCTSELLAVPHHVAWERDTGAVSSFAAIPQQLRGVRVWRPVHARGHCGHFLLKHEVLWLALYLLGFSVRLTNSRWTSTGTSSRSCSACTYHVYGSVRVLRLCPRIPPMRIC